MRREIHNYNYEMNVAMYMLCAYAYACKRLNSLLSADCSAFTVQRFPFFLLLSFRTNTFISLLRTKYIGRYTTDIMVFFLLNVCIFLIHSFIYYCYVYIFQKFHAIYPSFILIFNYLFHNNGLQHSFCKI